MKIDPHVFHAKFPHHCALDRCKSRCCGTASGPTSGAGGDPAARGPLPSPTSVPKREIPPLVRRDGGESRLPQRMAVGRTWSRRVRLLPSAHGCSLQKRRATGAGTNGSSSPLLHHVPARGLGGVLTVDEEMDEVWCLKDENADPPDPRRGGEGSGTTSFPRRSFASCRAATKRREETFRGVIPRLVPALTGTSGTARTGLFAILRMSS